MSRKNSVLLEVDPSITKNNLLISNIDPYMDEFESMMNQAYNRNNQGKSIHPKPGFCMKMWKEDGKKLYINICHCEELPKPEEVSEADLLKMLLDVSDTVVAEDIKYRVPMSIGLIREDKDRFNRECDVCDVVVNSDFFNEKVIKTELFKSFLINVVLEGVIEKNKVVLNQTKTPFEVKRFNYMGKVEKQMIQQRNKGENSGESGSTNKLKLIREISPSDKDLVVNKSKPSVTIDDFTLPFQIVIDKESVGLNGFPKYLIVNVSLEASTGKNFLVDVGEDRLVIRRKRVRLSTPSSNDRTLLASSNDRTLLDIFLQYRINQEACQAEFVKNKKVLSVYLPVKAG